MSRNRLTDDVRSRLEGSCLSDMDPRQGRIVELKYFVGLNNEETAEVLGVSVGTVKRDWNVAKAWLRREMLKNK